MEGARDLALEMANREGKLLDQFNNPITLTPITPLPGRKRQQTGGRITHFVSSMGTNRQLSPALSRLCA